MEIINNERYSTILEDVLICDNKFICSYKPVYGLVKIDNIVVKILNHKGTIFSNYNKDSVTIMYIREKVYTEGFRNEELSENEIYKLLIRQ